MKMKLFRVVPKWTFLYSNLKFMQKISVRKMPFLKFSEKRESACVSEEWTRELSMENGFILVLKVSQCTQKFERQFVFRNQKKVSDFHLAIVKHLASHYLKYCFYYCSEIIQLLQIRRTESFSECFFISSWY